MSEKQLHLLIKKFEASQRGEREQKLKLNINECLELIAHYEKTNKNLANSLLLYRKMLISDKLELITAHICEEEKPLIPILAELRKGKNVEDYNIVALQHLCERLWDINKLWLLIDKEKQKDEEKAAQVVMEKKVKQPSVKKLREENIFAREREDKYPNNWSDLNTKQKKKPK